MSLATFPTRIAIGKIEKPGTKPVLVYMTDEFSRALSSLLGQIGDGSGLDVDSVAILASFTPEPAVAQVARTLEGGFAGASPEVVALRDELAQSNLQRDAAYAGFAALERRLEALEMQLPPSDTGTDWEHPGKIGARTANTGAFTVANLGAGAVGAPSLYLGTDNTTGLYRPAANNWALSVSGVLVATWSATGVAYAQNVSTTKQFVTTLAIGTAPLVVTSTTLVPNLYVARAVLADTATILTAPTTYPANATDLPTVITLANALKAANVAKGV